ncbi:MAG: flagellar assembly protein FliX [Siculibacillus sp.]
MAIRIDGPGRTSGLQGPAPTKRGEGLGAAFTLPNQEDAPQRAAVVSTPIGVQDLSSLLALQQGLPSEDPRERKRRAVRHGLDLLDVLEGVKFDLLSGAVPTDRLERLVAMMAKRPASGDEKLDALVADIELRARVELAKYGRYPD